MGPNSNTKNKNKNKKTKASKIPNCNQPINIFFSTKNSNQITPPKQATKTIKPIKKKKKLYETILKFKHYILTLYSLYIPLGALIGPKFFHKALWSFQTHPLIFQNQRMPVIKQIRKEKKSIVTEFIYNTTEPRASI